MNSVNLIGRLVRDVELRQTANGKDMVNFTIAIDNGKDREADFVSCQAWNHTAKFMADYLSKGDLVGIEGKLSPSSYEDKDGKMVYRQDVTAFRVNGLSYGNKENKARTNSNNELVEPKIDISDNDLPF